VIDSDGYRPNVGIILSNSNGELLWARRIGQDAWQFPQGGIRPHETPEQAMYRELGEEVGLRQRDVEMIASTQGWLRYRLPHRYIRHNCRPLCIGQKQVWFMLRLVGPEARVRLDMNEKPEFDLWRWVDYWQPLREVVSFKRRVYECALKEFAPLVLDEPQRRRVPPRARSHPYRRSRRGRTR
jgi:putative (di)nucleoside polyphosphate hydrolase